jgi:uncharacterized protein (TIGR00730 family)
MKVSVFGGSQPTAGTPAYEEARQLGQILALRGHVVMNGGYIGTMEAVSRGAAEAGGHVIGVTCEDIEKWRNVGPNAWIKEEWRRKSLIERLQALVEGCDAAIALSGGPGTLTEVSVMWNLMIVESMHRRPLVLVGSGWQSVIDQFLRSFNQYTSETQRSLVLMAKDVNTAVMMLENRIESFPE